MDIDKNMYFANDKDSNQSSGIKISEMERIAIYDSGSSSQYMSERMDGNIIPFGSMLNQFISMINQITQFDSDDDVE